MNKTSPRWSSARCQVSADCFPFSETHKSARNEIQRSINNVTSRRLMFVATDICFLAKNKLWSFPAIRADEDGVHTLFHFKTVYWILILTSGGELSPLMDSLFLSLNLKTNLLTLERKSHSLFSLDRSCDEDELKIPASSCDETRENFNIWGWHKKASELRQKKSIKRIEKERTDGISNIRSLRRICSVESIKWNLETSCCYSYRRNSNF